MFNINSLTKKIGVISLVFLTSFSAFSEEKTEKEKYVSEPVQTGLNYIAVPSAIGAGAVIAIGIADYLRRSTRYDVQQRMLLFDKQLRSTGEHALPNLRAQLDCNDIYKTLARLGSWNPKESTLIRDNDRQRWWIDKKVSGSPTPATLSYDELETKLSALDSQGVKVEELTRYIDGVMNSVPLVDRAGLKPGVMLSPINKILLEVPHFFLVRLPRGTIGFTRWVLKPVGGEKLAQALQSFFEKNRIGKNVAGFGNIVFYLTTPIHSPEQVSIWIHNRSNNTWVLSTVDFAAYAGSRGLVLAYLGYLFYQIDRMAAEALHEGKLVKASDLLTKAFDDKNKDSEVETLKKEFLWLFLNPDHLREFWNTTGGLGTVAEMTFTTTSKSVPAEKLTNQTSTKLSIGGFPFPLNIEKLLFEKADQDLRKKLEAMVGKASDQYLQKVAETSKESGVFKEGGEFYTGVGEVLLRNFITDNVGAKIEQAIKDVPTENQNEVRDQYFGQIFKLWQNFMIEKYKEKEKKEKEKEKK